MIVSGVPRMRRPTAPTRRAGSRWLVDVFYDQRVKLIVSAAGAAPSELLVREPGARAIPQLKAMIVPVRPHGEPARPKCRRRDYLEPAAA